jgi:hypothetical protein
MYNDDLYRRSSLDNLNRLIMRGLVPVRENTQKRGETHGKYN